jgi:hypothetical protein
MSLEQAIHEYWASTAALDALLPAARVTTGRSSGVAMPYATIEQIESRPTLPTNLGDAVEAVTIRVTLWHDDHAAGHAIAEQVEIALDRATLTLPGGGQVARFRRLRSSVSQHPDGLWQWTVELRARVHLD